MKFFGELAVMAISPSTPERYCALDIEDIILQWVTEHRIEAVVPAPTHWAIRNAGGDEICGEYAIMICSGPEDWSIAEMEIDDATPGTIHEFEILEMRPVSKRKFVVPYADDNIDDSENDDNPDWCGRCEDVH